MQQPMLKRLHWNRNKSNEFSISFDLHESSVEFHLFFHSNGHKTYQQPRRRYFQHQTDIKSEYQLCSERYTIDCG